PWRSATASALRPSSQSPATSTSPSSSAPPASAQRPSGSSTSPPPAVRCSPITSPPSLPDPRTPIGLDDAVAGRVHSSPPAGTTTAEDAPSAAPDHHRQGPR